MKKAPPRKGKVLGAAKKKSGPPWAAKKKMLNKGKKDQ
jgi:hypothetical protein